MHLFPWRAHTAPAVARPLSPRLLWSSLACLFALLFLASCLAQAPLTMPGMPLHDPFILASAEDQTYYLYTSNQPEISGVAGVGTMAYRSTDLKHWQKPIVVFTVPSNAFGREGAWAPEVHRYRGRYYLFTTLFDNTKVLAQPPTVPLQTVRRGTVLAVADRPTGPFTLVHPDSPITPPDFMTLDGTLYVDPAGKPWLVYAHEWIQKLDGTMEALPLTPDLVQPAGRPIFLFKASDAPWLDRSLQADTKPNTYVTDGPELFRTRSNHLLMLWSSYDRGSYVQTLARSRSGTLQGPWDQLEPLVGHDSGHGMLFHTFDGHLMLVLHQPFRHARGRLLEVDDAGDHLEVLRERTDLDGATTPVLP